MPALSHSASSSSPSVGSALRHATRQMASRKSSKPRWVRFTRDLLSFSESCERYAKGARSRHNQRHNQRTRELQSGLGGNAVGVEAAEDGAVGGDRRARGVVSGEARASVCRRCQAVAIQ